MAIFKRGKTWWGDFSVNGQRYRNSLRTKDWREAQARQKELITRASQGKLAPSSQQLGRLPFSQAADRYLEHRRVEVSGCTWQTDVDKMKPLRKFFAGMRLSQINCDFIRTYQAKRHASGRHPRTINHEVKLLLRLLRRGKIQIPDVKLLPVQRSPIRILSPAE